MQRSKGGCGVQLPGYAFVNQAMLPEFWAAMHDTVPDRSGRG